MISSDERLLFDSNKSEIKQEGQIFLDRVASILKDKTKANVIIEGTRIIYKEGERDATVKLTNTNDQKNALVQVWLDDGNSAATPEDAVSPFIVTPPLAKIPAGRNQAVRITYVGDKMKPDRESVFWFNMLEIPPKSNEPNVLSFAVRTRIKLFYRPKGILKIPVTHGAKTEWQWKQSSKGLQVEVFNNSPYHLSYFDVSLDINQTNVVVSGGGMVPSFERFVFDVPDRKEPPSEKITLKLKAVNDYGGEAASEHVLLPVK
jgi:chaperone protein EcpD